MNTPLQVIFIFFLKTQVEEEKEEENSTQYTLETQSNY